MLIDFFNHERSEVDELAWTRCLQLADGIGERSAIRIYALIKVGRNGSAPGKPWSTRPAKNELFLLYQFFRALNPALDIVLRRHFIHITLPARLLFSLFRGF